MVAACGGHAMSNTHFPELIQQLPDFEGPFDAHRLAAAGCEVLFASYPAGTSIDAHTHRTNNVGVITEGELILTIDAVETRYGPGDWYRVDANEEHVARFDVQTSEIEFWFSV